MDDLQSRYYLDLAAAFVRGHLEVDPSLEPGQLVRHGLEAGLRMHRLKRTGELPRVRKVLGILRGFAPGSLLDVGSGRGVFLWPLLDAFPWLSVVAIDRLAHRVEDLAAARRGGIDRLSPALMDVTRLAVAEGSVDGVTILEVLEHLEHPERAAAEVVRAARRFVIASVPSREDDNPEHIHLFTSARLERLFLDAGARRVQVEAVLNHFIIVVRV